MGAPVRGSAQERAGTSRRADAFARVFYSHSGNYWRWGNAISSLLVPQRGILLGLPLAVIVFTQWWLATGERTDAGTGDTETRRKQAGKH